MCIYIFCIQDNKCFGQIKEFIIKDCPEKNIVTDLELILEKKAKDVGLLISQ